MLVESPGELQRMLLAVLEQCVSMDMRRALVSAGVNIIPFYR